MDDQDAALIASHAAGLFNSIEQADSEIGDDLLNAVASELADSSWCVEHVGGLWQARPAEEDNDDES